MCKKRSWKEHRTTHCHYCGLPSVSQPPFFLSLDRLQTLLIEPSAMLPPISVIKSQGVGWRFRELPSFSWSLGLEKTFTVWKFNFCLWDSFTIWIAVSVHVHWAPGLTGSLWKCIFYTYLYVTLPSGTGGTSTVHPSTCSLSIPFFGSNILVCKYQYSIWPIELLGARQGVELQHCTGFCPCDLREDSAVDLWDILDFNNHKSQCQ